MASIASTRHGEIGKFYYFDHTMTRQESTSQLDIHPSKVDFWITEKRYTPAQGRFHYEITKKRSISLFLCNNQWKHYEPIAWYGYSDNLAGFVFNYCVACGEKRFKKEDFGSAHLVWSASPIDCGESQCDSLLTSFTGKEARELFYAIRTQNAKDLQYYSSSFARDR